MDQLGNYEPAGDAGTPPLLVRPVVTAMTAQYAAGLHEHEHGILTHVHEQQRLSKMQAIHASQKAAAARPYQQ